jgi:uncharacterized protein YutE (UPF0331/DUF86 family)
MTRNNEKDKELLSFGELMLTAEDYAQRIQRLNGFRMGLTNKYKYLKEDQLDSITKAKRLTAWKVIIDLYK